MAGGPIQSLTNLVFALDGFYNISVITSAYDLHTELPYAAINIDCWNKINLPGVSKAINVYYTSKQGLNLKKIALLIDEVSPDTVYLNGIYSRHFFLSPLRHLKSTNHNLKVIVCPRGMLQEGALAVKPFKKKIYLLYLRISSLLNRVYWHAINEEESNDIKRHFTKNRGVYVAPNIPKSPLPEIFFPVKEKQKLKLVYLSLIAEKKNLLLLLQLMQKTDDNISLDIYGPIVDKRYWQQCLALIKKVPAKVQYKGEVQPVNVQELLLQYHAMVLLTKGENFGHALYESLSVGRPVITSFYTPWNDLQQNVAGANININNFQESLQKLNEFANMPQNEYNFYCSGAHTLACNYYFNIDAESKYSKLFQDSKLHHYESLLQK